MKYAAIRATKQLEAMRIHEPIVLDGRLDEPAWTRAPAAQEFHQQEPVEGAPPTEASEVRFLYDADALYVGGRFFDSDPRGGITNELQRDFVAADGDVVAIIRRRNERTFWSPQPRQFGGYRASYCGRLNGIRRVRPGRNLYVKPFVTGALSNVTLPNLGRRQDADGGIDAKYGLGREASGEAGFNRVAGGDVYLNFRQTIDINAFAMSSASSGGSRRLRAYAVQSFAGGGTFETNADWNYELLYLVFNETRPVGEPGHRTVVLTHTVLLAF